MNAKLRKPLFPTVLPHSTAELPVELYQLAPENSSLMQCYVLRTKSNKLIVIDGGIDGTGLDMDPYLPSALRAIAGVHEGEYFEVEAWFLSHAHKDHFNELSKMLNAYTTEANYKINNFYFDFPPYGTNEYPAVGDDKAYLDRLIQGFDIYAEMNQIEIPNGNSYYDILNGAVINAEAVSKGLELNIDGIRIEILQTWHKSDSDVVNNNSIVIRVWVDGQSVLFLNDLGTAAGRRLLLKHKDDITSDIVQMAHHGQNGVDSNVYKAIDAKVHLWPTPLWVWTNTATFQIGETRKWLYGEDFQNADAFNIVACLYSQYPNDPTSVSDWVYAKDSMKIILPYFPHLCS